MNTEQERAELLPCPFCGRDGIRRHDDGIKDVIFCMDCGGSIGLNKQLPGDVSDKWNRRAALQSQDIEGNTQPIRLSSFHPQAHIHRVAATLKKHPLKSDTHDIELPPLPEPAIVHKDMGNLYTVTQMNDHLRAGVEAYLKHSGEPALWISEKALRNIYRDPKKTMIQFRTTVTRTKTFDDMVPLFLSRKPAELKKKLKSFLCEDHVYSGDLPCPKCEETWKGLTPQPAEPVNKMKWNQELSSWSDDDFVQVFHERPDLANRLRKILAEPVKHDLYKTGDKDAPEQILDRNGAVALDCCKRCGKFESQLSEPCVAEPVKVPSDSFEDALDIVSKALGKAWELGQTYWYQADSESWSQNRKSEATQAKFHALVDETRALLAKYGHPEGPKGEKGAKSHTQDRELARAHDWVNEPVAWMTEGGRVATAKTKDTSMPNASRESFHIPLFAALQPAEPVKPTNDKELQPDAVAACHAILPFLDSIICYASSIDQHAGNRAAKMVQGVCAASAAPQPAEPTKDRSAVAQLFREAISWGWGSHDIPIERWDARREEAVKCFVSRYEQLSESTCEGSCRIETDPKAQKCRGCGYAGS